MPIVSKVLQSTTSLLGLKCRYLQHHAPHQRLFWKTGSAHCWQNSIPRDWRAEASISWLGKHPQLQERASCPPWLVTAFLFKVSDSESSSSEASGLSDFPLHLTLPTWLFCLLLWFWTLAQSHGPMRITQDNLPGLKICKIPLRQYLGWRLIK